MGGKREHGGDAAARVLLAGLERDAGDDGTVTVSGRCGTCGYVLGSPGCQVTCGTGEGR